MKTNYEQDQKIPNFFFCIHFVYIFVIIILYFYYIAAEVTGGSRAPIAPFLISRLFLVKKLFGQNKHTIIKPNDYRNTIL